MGKSSKSITLALIGSALLLPGCQDEEPPVEVVAGSGEAVADPVDEFGFATDEGGYYGPEGQGGSSSGMVRHHRSPAAGIAGAIIGSQIARGLSRGGSAPLAPSPAAAPSARGGFGATGSGFGGSGGLGASS